jgi:hypothetical protein
MLYFRQILIMLVSFYTVQAVLEVLGAEDYGIYNEYLCFCLDHRSSIKAMKK